MSDLLSTVPRLQKNRNASMARVLRFHKTLREGRVEHLGHTVRWAGEIEQYRSDRARREPFQRDTWFRNIPTGHPELIHRTWADMVY